MARSKFTTIFAVLAALTLFFGGMLSYKVIAGRESAAVVSRPTTSGSGYREALGIQGRVVIQVIRSGRVVETWKGHNSLTSASRNAIAACLSGLQPAPSYFSCTTGMTPWILLEVSGGQCGGWCAGHAATSSVLPAGCNPQGGYPIVDCSGWQTTATVDINADESVIGAAAATATGIQFDIISLSTPLAVSNGDRVQTTITFTVS